jgi:hypothetical protein
MRRRRHLVVWQKQAIFAGCASALAMFLLPRPCFAGPPFLTDDPVPVDYGHWEIYGFSIGAFVKGAAAGMAPAIEVNNGTLPNVQLHFIAPLAFSRSNGMSTEFGPGDLEFGVKYRFLTAEPDDWWPQIGIFPMLEVPTGNAERNLGTGSTHAFLPLWLQKDSGKWMTYGGGGYWINPGPGNKNYWFAGWVLQRQVTDSLALGGEIFHQTSFATGGPGSPCFPLGSKDTTGFNLGGTYDFDQNHHLLFSAGRALQNASTTNAFSYYLALQWTF